MRNDPFDLTPRPEVIGRIVTATVALVCLLIVYDGWATLKLFDVVLVILGPVVAICTTHIFSNTLVQLVTLGRRPTMKEWLVTARFESRFLLLAVPPLAVLLVLHLANVALTDAVQVVIWLEALSLSFWAGLAAWYSGLRGPAARALDPRGSRHQRHGSPAPGHPAAGEGGTEKGSTEPLSAPRHAIYGGRVRRPARP
jgi:hypothetical protein